MTVSMPMDYRGWTIELLNDGSHEAEDDTCRLWTDHGIKAMFALIDENEDYKALGITPQVRTDKMRRRHAKDWVEREGIDRP